MATETRRRYTSDIQSLHGSLTESAQSRETDEGEPPEPNYLHDVNLEATRLEHIATQYSRASVVITSQAQTASVPSKNRVVQYISTTIVNPVHKFWRRQVSITVEHSTCRDHLALERTFLGYLRTSLVFSTLGVAVAQLFRLQHVANPNPVFGYFKLGKPLAVICQCFAIYSLLLGAFRTWRHQNAIVRGKAISGGFEVIMLAVGTLLIVLTFFTLLLAVDISKEDIKKT